MWNINIEVSCFSYKQFKKKRKSRNKSKNLAQNTHMNHNHFYLKKAQKRWKTTRSRSFLNHTVPEFWFGLEAGTQCRIWHRPFGFYNFWNVLRAHSGEPPLFPFGLDGRRVLIIQRHVYDVVVGFLMSFGKLLIRRMKCGTRHREGFIN